MMTTGLKTIILQSPSLGQQAVLSFLQEKGINDIPKEEEIAISNYLSELRSQHKQEISCKCRWCLAQISVPVISNYRETGWANSKSW